MTELPPPPKQPAPDAPVAGWYPDPSAGMGYRWWDGSVWTEATTMEPMPIKPTLGPIGPWLSESFRLWINRTGHVLPLLVLFVLWIGLAISAAAWFALRDTVLTFSPSSGAPELDYGGSFPSLVVMAALLPASAVLSFVFKAAVTRQAWTAALDRPEPWLDSLRHLRPRLGRVIAASLGRSAIYWVVGGLFWVGVLVSPVFVLLFPFVAVALFVAWFRLAFVGTNAVIGPTDTRPFHTSWRLTGQAITPLLGRLLLLAVVAFNMILAAGFLATPFAAIAGQGGSSVEPTADTLRLNDMLGPTLAGFALGSVFNALGIGANYSLAAVGTTLLYRRLDGPAERLAEQPDEPSVGSP